MKAKVKLRTETRTIEHIERIEIVPDDDAPDSAYVVVGNEIADDGGFVIVLTEEDA